MELMIPDFFVAMIKAFQMAVQDMYIGPINKDNVTKRLHIPCKILQG
jgi:hypothetical protein